jgi:hypothetical protein
VAAWGGGACEQEEGRADGVLAWCEIGRPGPATGAGDGGEGRGEPPRNRSDLNPSQDTPPIRVGGRGWG